MAFDRRLDPYRLKERTVKNGVGQRDGRCCNQQAPKAPDLEARDDLVGEPKERHVDEEWYEKKQEAQGQNGRDKQQAADEPAQKEVQHAEDDGHDDGRRRAADADVRKEAGQREDGQREYGQMQKGEHGRKRSPKALVTDMERGSNEPCVGEGSFEPLHTSSCVPTAVTVRDEPLKVALSLRGLGSFRRQSLQGIAGQAKDAPVAHLVGTERTIESDGRLVPFQDSPLEPTTTACDCEARKLAQERLTVPLSPMSGDDEEVFQVEPPAAKEGRVVVKEERESDDPILAALGDNGFGVRDARPKERRGELLDRPESLALELLVARKLENQRVNAGDVAR
jgi:hypothetical protein